MSKLDSGNYAMTIPLPTALSDQGPSLRELVDLGYKEAWSSEANGADAFFENVTDESRLAGMVGAKPMAW